MALAVATHHSAKTARGGVRPGVLEDPEPLRETEHEQPAALRGPKPLSPGVPSLAMPVLAGASGEGGREAGGGGGSGPTAGSRKCAQSFRPLVPPSREGGRGRRVGRKGLEPLHTLLEAALVVDTSSGMFLAGILVSVLPTLCSLRSSAGLSFQASWLGWRRRTVMLWPRSSIATVVCAMLVLLVVMPFVLCSLWSSPGLRCPASWPAWTRLRQWHVHGWFCGICTSRCVPFFVVRPKMLGIMAGMNQKKRYVASSLQGRRHLCRDAGGGSAVAVLRVLR